ncbi:MAG: hypothetical protein OXH36_03325 [Bdellovibrionales bacterium]|nr:hypothetical protein [Bdellovibrionales bacterium]
MISLGFTPKGRKSLKSFLFSIPVRYKVYLLIVFPVFVWAGETVIEVEQDSKDIKVAVQTAVKQVSVELMEQFIEPSKLKEQKKQIQKIISTYSNRYILYTKTAPPVEKEDETFVISVTIGFSEENLKKILLEEDLFYSGSSHLRILPLVLFENLVNRKNYGWWMEKTNASESVKKPIREFYNQIQSTLMSYGFFLINPESAGSAYFIPDDLRFTKAKKQKVFNLARFFQSHLVMTGFIKVRESDMDSILNLKMELAVYHSKSGRLLAEVERFMKVPVKEENAEIDLIRFFLDNNKNFTKGLGVQLRSIYEAGQLSSNLLKITVRGFLSYKNLNRFSQLLSSKMRDIKNLQEHIIRSKSITYVASTNAGAKDISAKIKDTVFPGFYVSTSRVTDEEIILKVRINK